MSMVLCLDTASDQSIAALLSSPNRIASWIETSSQGNALGDEHVQVDLDKAWHAIHFLLTGSAEAGTGPEAFLLVGGTPIGNVDVGYGPARAFRAADVAAISRALSAVGPETLRSRFNHQALHKARIYPSIWNRNDLGDIDYVLEYYTTLLHHLNSAAAKGLGLVIYLT